MTIGFRSRARSRKLFPGAPSPVHEKAFGGNLPGELTAAPARNLMRTFPITIALTVLAVPAFGADSVFVDRAWNGTWFAKFPPFVNVPIGPATLNQISDALGRARMDALRTPGTAAANCPGPGERTEYYEGTYNYNNRGQWVGCTNGEHFFAVYRDDSGPDRGVILITETFPDEQPPRFKGTFTTDGSPTGDMEGFYQGDGIDTPLARVGPNGQGGGGEGGFTGCQFLLPAVQLYPHHPLLYASVGRRYLGLELPRVEVIALVNDQPVDEGTAILITASAQAFPGSDGMPEASERTEMTDESGLASFRINPPAPAPTQTIELTAGVTIGDQDYQCTGAIVTGINPLFVPYLDRVDEAVTEIQRLETEDDRMAQGGEDESPEVLAAETRSPRRPPEPASVRLPLVFEENRGQGAPTARYLAKTLRGELQVGPTHIAIPRRESDRGRRSTCNSSAAMRKRPTRWSSGCRDAATISSAPTRNTGFAGPRMQPRSALRASTPEST